MTAMTNTVVKTQSFVDQPSGAQDGGAQLNPSTEVTSPPVIDMPLLPPVRAAKSMPKKFSDLTMAGKARAKPRVTSAR